MEALVALYRGRGISRSDFAAGRARWLAAEKDRPLRVGTYGVGSGSRWIRAYAQSAVTIEDAKEALAALPEYLPMPAERVRTAEQDEAIGETYLLAGRAEQAIPFLRRAAYSCKAAEHPFHHTWANLYLGRALEQHDAAGACVAYKVVVDRWGLAPESRAAREAIERRKALACP